jgi:hypothetical protein
MASEILPPSDSNVFHLDLARTAKRDRIPSLTDAELLQIRDLLANFSLICQGCPTARRLLEEA